MHFLLSTLIFVASLMSIGSHAVADPALQEPKFDPAVIAQFNSSKNQFSVREVDADIALMRKTNNYAIKFTSNDAPKDVPLFLVLMSLGEVAHKEWVHFNGNGQMCYANSEEPFHLVYHGYAPGQQCCFYLLNAEGIVLTNWRHVPFPFTVSQSGYTVNVTFNLLPELSHTYLLIFEGFEPGEKVRMISRSGHEVIKDCAPVDETGHLFISSAPAVRGQKGGWCTYTVMGKKGRIDVTYPWGNKFYAWAKNGVDRQMAKRLSEPAPDDIVATGE